MAGTKSDQHLERAGKDDGSRELRSLAATRTAPTNDGRHSSLGGRLVVILSATAMLVFADTAFGADVPALTQAQAELSLGWKLAGWLLGVVAGFLAAHFVFTPESIRRLEFYRQALAIATLLLAGFTLATWLLSVNSDGPAALLKISLVSLSIGFVAFLCHAYIGSRKDLVGTPHGTTAVLGTFILFASATPTGLIGLAQLVIATITNPLNTQAFPNITISRLLEYNVHVRVVGHSLPNGVASGPLQIVPFRISSGYVAFGCEETLEKVVTFALPTGGEPMGEVLGRWENVANASAFPASATWVQNTATAKGSIRGLPYQQIIFARNCPGGGHGELVLTGQYGMRDRKPSLPIERKYDNSVIAGRDPVPLTLPGPDEIVLERVEAVFAQSTLGKGEIRLTVTPEKRTATDETGVVSIALSPDFRNLFLGAKR